MLSETISEVAGAPHPQLHYRPGMSIEPDILLKIDVRKPPDTFVDLRA
jgi:hypothetical protein